RGGMPCRTVRCYHWGLPVRRFPRSTPLGANAAAMELRDHARHLLQFSRRFTENLLASFKTPEDWVFQIHPKVNHAMWITGHLGLVDNSFICKFRPDRGRKPEAWDQLFGFGSQPQPRVDAYPSVADVQSY